MKIKTSYQAGSLEKQGMCQMARSSHDLRFPQESIPPAGSAFLQIQEGHNRSAGFFPNTQKILDRTAAGGNWGRVGTAPRRSAIMYAALVGSMIATGKVVPASSKIGNPAPEC